MSDGRRKTLEYLDLAGDAPKLSVYAFVFVGVIAVALGLLVTRVTGLPAPIGVPATCAAVVAWVLSAQRAERRDGAAD